MTVAQSSELDSNCRFLLMQHAQTPNCMFGNILDRAPRHALQMLDARRCELLQQCSRSSKKRKGSGWCNCEADGA